MNNLQILTNNKTYMHTVFHKNILLLLSVHTCNIKSINQLTNHKVISHIHVPVRNDTTQQQYLSKQVGDESLVHHPIPVGKGHTGTFNESGSSLDPGLNDMT